MKRFVSLSALLAGLLVFQACGGGGAAEPVVTVTSAAVPTPNGSLVTPTPSATSNPHVSIDGHWEGATLYRERDLITLVHFETSEAGHNGTLDFPEIGREGLVLSKVSFEPPKVRF